MTEHTVVYRVSGESVTLECSFAESPYSNDELIGMYLYHNAKTQEEVLYYHSSPGVEKISPRVRYSKRVEKKGSLENHTITISNLTVEDSSIYRCVYKKNAQSEDIRNVYILVVSEKESEPDGNEKCLPLVLIISVTSAISIMVTMIFIWLIVPKRITRHFFFYICAVRNPTVSSRTDSELHKSKRGGNRDLQSQLRCLDDGTASDGQSQVSSEDRSAALTDH
ncbi:uncharacterized protein AKAME5_002570300 [Lates japonicus]|uniref:Ig-like domain-containing protein n=1 Tax=Lates japonicus TaxID=270547 RepID=A0AAD3NNR7_LATJO|nr:uncharacterized protein AKAME5_002570300 [Lates japonicus]